MIPARKPAWLFPERRDIGAGNGVRRVLRDLGVATVCESARCPNRGECFTAGTATFLILGETCTRRCGFCAVAKGVPAGDDPDAPRAVAAAVGRLGLTYAVVTSVTRDDLPDGGAAAFAAVLHAVRVARPHIRVEVLLPDFAGAPGALETVLAAAPAVVGHNVETVPRLYSSVRAGADYARSLALLRRARELAPEIPVKSGLMVGLGEDPSEIVAVLGDLAAAGCTWVTIGQYLQPTRRHPHVARYLTPAEFATLAAAGRDLGIAQVLSGPLVRSSYRAHAVFAGEPRR